MDKTVYVVCHFTIKPLSPYDEMLIAYLSALGFDSFEQTDTGVIAYIEEKLWTSDLFSKVPVFKLPDVDIDYHFKKMNPKNWNEVWESNFQPIVVADKVGVRADFHPPMPNLPYEMVITPKMSFGTGHHQTTALMLQYLLELDLEGKTVLDMGCGTGILGIFAHIKKARQVLAIDIDPWCYENTLENVEKNQCKGVQVQRGDASLLTQKQPFDVVIANINRRILLQDLSAYVGVMQPMAWLLLSGFYKADVPLLNKVATAEGLILKDMHHRDDWTLLAYQKV